MKGTLFIAMLLAVCSPVLAQWSDNFSDGDFTANPAWQGSTTDFIIDTQMLRLNAPAQAGVSHLATASDVSLEATWQFFVRLDFNPSSSNYAQVFLMADTPNLQAVSNGYFIKVGGTPDEVSLYKLANGQETLIIDGTDGRVSSTTVEITIKVTRDAANLWQVSTQLTGEPNFTVEGSFTDAEIQSSAWFGVLCNYTSSRSTKFYFDDISVTGQGLADTEPPVLTSVTTPATNQILLVFNEPLDTIQARQPAAYQLNGTLNPGGVTVLSSDSLLLQFTQNLALDNTLVLNNIPDVAGNLLTTTRQVLYIDPAPYSYRQLVLNELLADPTPAEDLPLFEFVELYNNSNRIIDVNEWQLTDGSKTATLASAYIFPDSFLIIGPTEVATEYASYGPTMGLTNWPSLNNSGDALRLTDATGLLIDSVTYKLSWYNDTQKDDGGWTLEHIAPSISSSDSTNWTASVAVEGGTPGKKNSVYDNGIDEEGPEVIKVLTPDAFTIALVFNEPLDSNVSADAGFTLNNSLQPASVVWAQPDTLMLSFAQQIELVNNLQITGVKDTLANPTDTLLTVYYISPAFHQYRDVVINEILADPSPQEELPQDEFVELLNTSNKVIDLTGWQYTDGTKTATLPTVYLLPDSMLILCPEDALAAYSTYGAALGLSDWPSLNNSSDSLVLTNAQGVVIDSVAYELSWYNNSTKDDGGWSLEQINPYYLCPGVLNWTASVQIEGGTPGSRNSVFSTGASTAPVITQALATDTLLELWFSAPVKPGNYMGQIMPGAVPASISLVQPAQYASYVLPEVLSVTGKYTVEFPLEDCVGNSGTSIAYLLPIAQPKAGELVINELLFDPYSGGSDFVELFNTTDAYVNLKHFNVGNADTKDELADTTLLLAPQHYLAVSEDILYLKNQYLAPDSSLLEANLPTMPNDEGIVVLFDAKGKVLDSVYYSDEFHFSLLADTEGVSLERISTTEPSTNSDNWRSGAETTGFATPGYQNAQATTPVTEAGVTVTPQVITPNNDGVDDFAQISFELDAQSQVISMAVYTLNGQLVKTLASNAIVPPQGFFTWDGTNLQGGVLPTAHYIIITEVLTSDGRTLTMKNKIVVAHRF